MRRVEWCLEKRNARSAEEAAGGVSEHTSVSISACLRLSVEEGK